VKSGFGACAAQDGRFKSGASSAAHTDAPTPRPVAAPSQVHRSLDLARDPSRASQPFLSAARGRTARDIADESAAPLVRCARVPVYV
jgi:hypothetical protein